MCLIYVLLLIYFLLNGKKCLLNHLSFLLKKLNLHSTFMCWEQNIAAKTTEAAGLLCSSWSENIWMYELVVHPNFFQNGSYRPLSLSLFPGPNTIHGRVLFRGKDDLLSVTYMHCSLRSRNIFSDDEESLTKMIEASMIFGKVLFFLISRAGKFNLVCKSKRTSFFGARFRNVHIFKLSKMKVLKWK